MSKATPKVVSLLAHRTRERSEKSHSYVSDSGAYYCVLGPIKAQYDFIVELDNGEAYSIGLVTDDPPDIAWFQEHFGRARHAYKKVR